MLDPDECFDDRGQYAEARYVGSQTVSLAGLVISDNSGSWSVRRDVVVAPGDLVTLIREPSAGFTQCYGLAGDIAWPGILGLSRTGDFLSLSNASGLLDEVRWDGWQVPTGAALQLDPSREDVLANDQEDSWCPAVSVIPGHLDRGTPGYANASCGGVGPLPTDTSDTGDTDDTGSPPIDTGPLPPAVDLILSEIGDPTNFDNRYVEVHNPTTVAVDLSDYSLERFANGSSTGLGAVDLGPGMLQPGDSWVVARAGASAAAFLASLGGSFDQTSPTADGNGDDAYALQRQGTTIDVFGVIGQTPGAWDYEDQVAVRLDCHTSATTSFAASSWAFLPQSMATPGTHPDPRVGCGGVVITPVDTGDSSVPDTDTDTDTDVDTDTDLPPIDTSVGGGLIISQVVDWPGFDFRFVEVANRSGQPISLTGYELWRYSNGAATPSTTGGTVALGNDTVGPGDAWVIGQQAGQGGFAGVFGSEPDAFDSMISGNGDDVYALVFQGQVVDVYGVVGVDGTGEPWEYSDATATRRVSIVAPSPVFHMGEWDVSTDPAAATLGTHP